MNTKDIGDQAEAQILCRLIAHADTVLVPFGENQDYDLAFDIGGRIYRVQAKNGKLGGRTAGTVSFSVSSTYRLRGQLVHRSLAEGCDFFGVFCPELNEAWLVPSAEVGAREGTLKVEGKGGRGTRLATEYEVSKVVAGLR